jgi:predicted nucleic acid-binding protein
MAQKPLIVPDASVMLPAYFRETLIIGDQTIDLSKRASRLDAAIATNEVTAPAPELLRFEFVKRARDKVGARSGSGGLDPQEATAQVHRFLSLPIIWVPGIRLDTQAWSLSLDIGTAPPDSWYLACAIQYGAELWISHRHKDGFVDLARSVHDKVYTLTDDFKAHWR